MTMGTSNDSGAKRSKVPAGQSGKLPDLCLVPKYISQAVVSSVCHERVYDTAPKLVLGARRCDYLPQARFMIMFVLRAVWGDPAWSGAFPRAWATYQQIGLVVRREYTTAMYGCEQAEALCQADPDFADRLLAALDLLSDRLGPREKARIANVKQRVVTL